MDKIKLKRLKLARVKYFDKEHNGAEVNDIDAYAFLYEKDGEYVNLFNPAREYPVYGRVPYTNTTRDGEDFGSKIVLRSGEVESGPCYIIDMEDCSKFFGKDKMSLDSLKQYMMMSSSFFIDRLEMMQEGTKREKILHYKKIQQDRTMHARFNQFMDSHENMTIHK